MPETKDKKIYLLNNDIIFKNTFNKEELLKRLLEETLELKVREIFSANTELPIDYKKEKIKVLDLIVVTDKGIINVEVNNDYREDIYIRNFLYFCKLISSHLKKKNKNYSNVIEHIQLNITWHLQKYFPDIDMRGRKKIEFYIMEPESKKKIMGKIFKIVNINMDYYTKVWYSKNEKSIKKENPFIMLLAASNYEEMEKISKGDRLMEEISKDVKKYNIDPTLANEIAELAAIENENEIWENTIRERTTEQRNIEIAENMLKDSINPDIIAKYTGLSMQEIKKIQKS